MKTANTQDLDELLAGCRGVRRRYEPDAFLNLAFYSGKQWIMWDGQMLAQPELEPWRELVTDNRIRPALRTEIAKLTKTRPKWVGVPKTQSDMDIQASRYAEQALDDAWKRHSMLRKLRASLLWARICGAGYWKVWWDSTLGNKRDVLVYGEGHDTPGKLVRDGYGAPVTDTTMLTEMGVPHESKTVANGDICIEVRSFFQVYLDPLCTDDGLESAEYLFEEAVYSRGWVETHFGKDKADQLSYDCDPQSGTLEARLPLGGFYETPVTGEGKGAKIREFWSLDEHIIYSGETELLREPNRYPWLPYVMFRGVPVPGRAYPDGVVTDLRPRQTDLNKRLSQIADNADRIANPPLLVPSTLGDDFVWSGLPGERVDYQDTGSPNAMPSFMNVPNLPAYVENDIERILSSIMEISGQHEVTSGNVPAGVTAASAISLLQEADDTRLGPDVADLEEALTHAGRRILYFIRNFYTEERHIAISGEYGIWDVMAFKGAMTNGCEDIEVEAGSGMPDSKAGKQAAIQQIANLFAQNGQPVSPRDWRRMLTNFQVGGLEAFFGDVERDEQQVMEENRVISQLQKPVDVPINSFDNDEAHIEFHSDYQKTSQYQQLNPGAKASMENHVNSHRMRLAAAQMPMSQPGTDPNAPSGPPAPTGPEPGPEGGSSPQGPVPSGQ